MALLLLANVALLDRKYSHLLPHKTLHLSTEKAIES